jgi:hypothetical protein
MAAQGPDGAAGPGSPADPPEASGAHGAGAPGEGTGAGLPAPAGGSLPAVRDALDADALAADGESDQSFEKEDLALPFFRVVQSNSPAVDPEDAGFVQGAKVGDFINSVTNELWDGKTGIHIVPVAYMRSHIRWRPRTAGGGLVKDFGADSSIMSARDEQGKPLVVRIEEGEEKGRLKFANGDYLNVSGQYFAFLVDPESGMYQAGVFNLSGTQAKKSRKWNAAIQNRQAVSGGKMFKPAMFYDCWHITTVREENEKGKWAGVVIRPFMETLQLPRGRDIYLAARAFKDQVMAGNVKVHEEGARDDMPSGGAGGDPDDMPF